ncbi:MAG TPA: terminase small subunit [Cellvibrio sp.]|nr:terminase small subunit [Cellvibrio sp.]
MSDDIGVLKADLDKLASSMKPMHLAMAKALSEGKTQEEAYRLAGGKGKDAKALGCQLILTNPNISEYIELAKLIASKFAVNALEITEERIMRELGNLGFFNIKKLYSEDGRLLEPHELPDDVAAAVTKIKETVIRTDKETGDVVLRREYEMADKKGALQLLGNSRAIQMFREHKVIDTSLDALIDELSNG